MPDALHIPVRRDVLEHYRRSEQKIAAVFPIHYHRALLRAHDLVPVELWGPAEFRTSSADAHLQAYTCSIVRCGLSFALDGGLDNAQVILVPHSCDSLQGLGSVFLDFIRPNKPVQTLYVPRGQREIDVAFLAQELLSLDRKLSEITGERPSEKQLHSCIDKEQKADKTLGKLLENRTSIPLSNRALYDLMRCRQYLSAESFEHLAHSVLGATDRPKAKPAIHKIVLSGIVPEPMELLSIMDKAGLIVTGDDTACIGRRLYPTTSDDDPFVRMARSMLGASPDSALGRTVESRITHLVNLTRQTHAQGIVFWSVKFCEPELFYMPQIVQGLGRAGIRTLLIEVDISEPASAQIQTRLEAFAESLP